MRPSRKARGERNREYLTPLMPRPAPLWAGCSSGRMYADFCNGPLAAGQPEHHRDEGDAVDGSLGARLVKPQLLVDRHPVTR